jgi:hypothetical protein
MPNSINKVGRPRAGITLTYAQLRTKERDNRLNIRLCNFFTALHDYAYNHHIHHTFTAKIMSTRADIPSHYIGRYICPVLLDNDLISKMEWGGGHGQRYQIHEDQL